MKKTRILAGFILTLSFFTACQSNDMPAPDKEPTGEQFYGEPFGGVPAAKDIVMYEANERLFASQGSFNAITARLDNIKALGVNTLWLMPINEQGVDKAFGSPYCVKDYTNTEPEYGSLDDLRELVKQAHHRDMAVIIDWVANHTSWDNDWLSQYNEWYTKDANGNIIPPAGTNWSDVADLNFNNRAMRAEMIEAMKYWIREANIDGFRCDAADWVPASFWRDAIYELKNMQDGRKVLMLAEGTDPLNLQAGFDLDYGWNFCDVVEGLFKGNKNIADLYQSHLNEYARIPEGKQKLRFTTNHDRAAGQSPVSMYNGQQGALSAYVISTFMGGVPLIYSSQEVGYTSTVNFFQTINMDWDANPEINQSYLKIMDIYRSSPAFKEGALQTFEDEDVVCFTRSLNNETILVIVNIRNRGITFGVPEAFVSTTGTDLTDNSSIPLTETIQLDAYGFYLLKLQ